MERHKSVANSSFSRIDQSLDILQAQDPLGLNLVHDNENPTGDIIFVHGLGGTSIRTWSFNRDERYFWPPWLAETDELSTFRIFTMGYDANFRGGSVNLNTIDFSKSLLHEMLTFLDGKPIGSVPIIFVAHSMGGLVVKKAFVLGQHHDKYSIIISQVRAMLFLGTPHQGSSHSRILNTILKSMPGGSAKGYIAELDVKESSLQDLNEHFSRCSRDLHLVSFFETNMTSIGHLTKVMVSFL